MADAGVVAGNLPFLFWTSRFWRNGELRKTVQASPPEAIGMNHHPANPNTEDCITHCLDCHHICLEMAMNHCLELGGKHVAPAHFRLMLNCAEICQTSANFMLSGSELHH